jgi:glycosyltransferase involved in cell wall biosynthesis
MSAFTISVIIPSYNRRDLLLTCLDSVAEQSLLPNEIIVVDDGSTDGTIEALEKRDDIRLIVQENAGPGAARNRGANAATGQYIAFLDSDDVWFPWSLETMVSLIRVHSAKLLFGRFEDFSDQPRGANEPIGGMHFETYFESWKHGCFAGAGMMMMDRQAFLAAGGFSEDRLNAEDHDLALRMGDAKGFVQVTAPVTVAHRVHDGNEMNDLEANENGLKRIVQNELNGVYPGGEKYAAMRRSIISSHVRPMLLRKARSKDYRSAWSLFVSTAGWSLGLSRLPYLMVVSGNFFLSAVKGLVQPRAKSRGVSR